MSVNPYLRRALVCALKQYKLHHRREMASTLRLCGQLSLARLASRDVPPSNPVQRSLPALGTRAGAALLSRTAFLGASLSGGVASNKVCKHAYGLEKSNPMLD